TDDMREAPAVPIIQGLLARGAKVRAFDPEAHDSARRIFGKKIHYARNAYDALKDVDALLVVPEWNEVRQPHCARLRRAMKPPALIDGRNIFEPRQIRALGFTYSSIGRP